MDDYHRPARRERPSLEGGRGWSSSGSSGGGGGGGGAAAGAGPGSGSGGGGGGSVVGGGSGGGGGGNGGGTRHRAASGRHSSGGGRHQHPHGHPRPHSEGLLRSVLRRLGSASGGSGGGGGGGGYGPPSPSSPSAAAAAAASARERRRRAAAAACATLGLFLLMAAALYSVTGGSSYAATAGPALAARLFGLQPRTEHARRIAAAQAAARAAAATGAPPPPGFCIPPERETPVLAPSASREALGAYSEVVAASGGALGADPSVMAAPLLPPGPRGAPGAAASESGGRRRRRRLAAPASSNANDNPDLPGPASLDDVQVALVNDVAFHHEVTLGLAAALAPRHASRLTVYVHARLFARDEEEEQGGGQEGAPAAAAGGANAATAAAAANGDPSSTSSASAAAAAAALRAGRRRPSSTSGNLGFLSYAQRQLPGVTWQNAYHKPGIRPCDVAIFVSPEFNIDYTREFISLARPRMSIMFFHEPRMELRRLRYMLGLHPFTGVAALAPHVARALHEHYPGGALDVHWMYPTLAAPCSVGGGGSSGAAEKEAGATTTKSSDNGDDDDRGVPCREGFAVQGKFDARRRNYKGLWKALGRYSTDLPAPMKRRRRPTADESDAGEAAARAAAAAAAAVEAGLDPGAAVAAAASEQEEEERLALASNRPLFVNVVGSGRLSDLGLPPGLAAAPPLDTGSLSSTSAAAAAAAASASPAARAFGGVRVYRDLPYAEYYDTLCRSEALLPLFSREGGYLAHKISSSVGASLSAAVPMLVPGGRPGARSGGGVSSSSSSSSSSAASLLPSFLSIYSHFTPEAVVELREGETEVQAAARLLAGGGGGGRELKAKREALRALRGVLNRQAASKLDGLMSASLGKPRSSGSQPAPVKAAGG